MNLFAVSFFGHREVDDPFVIEQQLEAIIRELLHTKEYVEFLVGRDGEFDQLVSSTVRRCKRTIQATVTMNNNGSANTFNTIFIGTTPFF